MKNELAQRHLETETTHNSLSSLELAKSRIRISANYTEITKTKLYIFSRDNLARK